PTAAPPKAPAQVTFPNGRGRPSEDAVVAADATSSWSVIESLSGLVSPGAEALLFRTRVSGHGTDDLALLVPQQGELSLIAHPAPREGQTGYARAEVSTRPHPGSPVAVVSMRL